MFYRGYTIRYTPSAPVTGRWRGVRHGVGLCADSKEALTKMIDVRCEERRLRN